MCMQCMDSNVSMNSQCSSMNKLNYQCQTTYFFQMHGRLNSSTAGLNSKIDNVLHIWWVAGSDQFEQHHCNTPMNMIDVHMTACMFTNMDPIYRNRRRKEHEMSRQDYEDIACVLNSWIDWLHMWTTMTFSFFYINDLSPIPTEYCILLAEYSRNLQVSTCLFMMFKSYS